MKVRWRSRFARRLAWLTLGSGPAEVRQRMLTRAMRRWPGLFSPGAEEAGRSGIRNSARKLIAERRPAVTSSSPGRIQEASPDDTDPGGGPQAARETTRGHAGSLVRNPAWPLATPALACPDRQTAGGPPRRPTTSDTTNRMMNTANRTQAISEETASVRNMPSAPAIRAMIRNRTAQ